MPNKNPLLLGGRCLILDCCTVSFDLFRFVSLLNCEVASAGHLITSRLSNYSVQVIDGVCLKLIVPLMESPVVKKGSLPYLII